ncbi:MAG: diguanylate cyclase [Polyangiaceae bacterium]
MRPLFTREALTENFTRVRAEERPAPASSGVFAVFEDSERKEDFLGLVTPTQIARYPWRIFADLLPTEAAPTVSGQTTLESTLASMESASVDALAVVDQKGRFAGVVTLVSLTRLLLAHARSSVSEIPREEEQLRAVMRALPDVALPDLRARVRAASRPPAPRPIVVVESEVLVADDIRSSLLRFGYDVPQIATSASEALTAVEAHHPALVIIDVRLDGGTADGIAAAAAIRTRYPTPIVFLIAYSDDAMLMRAQAEAPPHGYVLKPYQDFELQAAVEVALYRHALEQETRQQHALMAGVLSGMADAVAAADANGRIVLVNDAGRRAFGPAVSGADAERNDSIPEVRLLDRETPFPAEELPLSRALAGEVVRDVELFVRSANQPDGRFYSVDATPLFDAQGMVCGAVEVGRDVTEIRTARSKLEQELETDALTGVYNRRGFMDLASTTYQRARQSGHEPAVFFIDLNCMKEINDSLGHAEGDRLLIDVAWILRGCFRTSDIIGRLGGDEFVVLAPEAQEHADVLRERLLAAVDQFNAGSERAYRVSISIGLSQCVPGESPSLEELVEQRIGACTKTSSFGAPSG